MYGGTVTIIAFSKAKDIHPVALNLYMTIFVTIIYTPFIFIFDDISIILEQDAKFWINVLILGIITSAICNSLYFYIVYKIGVAQASSFSFLVPTFALILSFVILQENIKPHLVIGGAMAIFATFIINQKTTK